MNKAFGFTPGHDAFEGAMHDQRDVSPATNLLLLMVMDDARVDQYVRQDARVLRDQLLEGTLNDETIIDTLVQAVLDLYQATRGGK